MRGRYNSIRDRYIGFRGRINIWGGGKFILIPQKGISTQTLYDFPT